jgi:hypothetical protein
MSRSRLGSASVCSEFLLFLNEGMDSINHILDKSLLGSSKSSSVGNIENSIVSLGVLSVDTSDLDEVLVSDGVELFLLLHKLWKFDVHRGSEGGSQVGWARGDVTEMLIVRELADGLDVSGSSAESVEDLEDTSSLLHGDDSELILLIDPDEESLGIVVEDTSAGWPVSVQVASLQESVSLPII